MVKVLAVDETTSPGFYLMMRRESQRISAACGFTLALERRGSVAMQRARSRKR
jgi:hypothetical protein